MSRISPAVATGVATPRPPEQQPRTSNAPAYPPRGNLPASAQRPPPPEPPRGSFPTSAQRPSQAQPQPSVHPNSQPSSSAQQPPPRGTLPTFAQQYPRGSIPSSAQQPPPRGSIPTAPSPQQPPSPPPRVSIVAPVHQLRNSIHRTPDQQRRGSAGGASRPPEQPRTSIPSSQRPPPDQQHRPNDAATASALYRGSAAGSPQQQPRLEQPRNSIGQRNTQQPQPPRVLFSEEQFWAVFRDMNQPVKATEDSPWQFVTETRGFNVYRLFDEDSGLYEYKVFGVIHGCSPERFLDVFMDVHYRAKWDRNIKEVCEKTIDGRTAIYWEARFPFPLTNRDYVFTRERRDLEVDGRKIYVIMAKSVITSKFPEKPGLIRVNNYKQNVAIESDGSNGSKIYMHYCENPGGKVPTWAVNWATKTGVPNFVKDMQKACLSYQKKRSAAR